MPYREAKVGELASSGCDQQVLRLDVAMHHVVCVKVCNRGARRLHHSPHSLRLGELAVVLGIVERVEDVSFGA